MSHQKNQVPTIKYLKFQKNYVKTLLQLTAVYSTNKNNEKALFCSNKALNVVESIFKSLMMLFELEFIKENLSQSRIAKFEVFFQSFTDLQNFEQLNNNKLNSLKFIDWEHTPENNHKLFNTVQQNKNSKFDAKWLSNFGIIDIMMIKLFEMKDFEDDLCISVLKNDEFILEIIVLYSIIFYTQSTEKR